ncbi:MAG: hypothetical protein GC192_16040 [Bacteroidetes bacterium]|nr:hypothetical protein [Bacteroidota bacterium]
MIAIYQNPSLTSAMKNELDFLVFIGLSTGNIIRYVRTSGRIDEGALAELLHVTPSVVKKLEKVKGHLPNEWHKNLRIFFDN